MREPGRVLALTEELLRGALGNVLPPCAEEKGWGPGAGECYNQAALQPGSQQPRQGILRSDCPVWLSYPAAVSKKAVSLGDRQE